MSQSKNFDRFFRFHVSGLYLKFLNWIYWEFNAILPIPLFVFLSLDDFEKSIYILGIFDGSKNNIGEYNFGMDPT